MTRFLLLLALLNPFDGATAIPNFRLANVLNDNNDNNNNHDPDPRIVPNGSKPNTLQTPFLGSVRGAEDTNGNNSNQEKNDVQELYVEQHLDHFRLEDPRTFQQRYFASNRFVREGNMASYAFLCVGGEGPALDKSVLVDSVHCTGDMLEAAYTLFHERTYTSIHLFALEHRYYGESYPSFSSSQSPNEQQESPLTNEHLVFLSSRQAQADLAHFVTLQQHTLPAHTKWVTFGGSYPGMMSAWARLRFPHLISAAVSSSAPVQATLDFAAYQNHVAKVLTMAAVGGSYDCLNIVQQGHEQLSQLLLTGPDEKKAQVAQAFNICNSSLVFTDSDNIAMFLGDGAMSIDTQSNDPSCVIGLCNIDKKCQALLHSYNDLGLSPAQCIQTLVELDHKIHNVTSCQDMSWENAMAYIADPVLGQRDGLRSWLWQTCTEFGFYQTCEKGSQCPFGRGWHTLGQDMKMCQQAFGINASQVALSVQDTLEYYGGWNMASSRILSVNGDVDPWSELAIQQSYNSNLPAVVVRGASHHFWTHPSKTTDSPQVVAARRLIHKTIFEWLDHGDDVSRKEPETS